MKEIIETISSKIKGGYLNVVFNNSTTNYISLIHDTLNNIDIDLVKKNFDNKPVEIVYIISDKLGKDIIESGLNDRLSQNLSRILKRFASNPANSEYGYILPDGGRNYVISIFLVDNLSMSKDDKYNFNKFIECFKNTIIITDDVFNMNNSNYYKQRNDFVYDVKQTLVTNGNNLICFGSVDGVGTSEELLRLRTELYTIFDVCDNIEFVESYKKIDTVKTREKR